MWWYTYNIHPYILCSVEPAVFCIETCWDWIHLMAHFIGVSSPRPNGVSSSDFYIHYCTSSHINLNWFNLAGVSRSRWVHTYCWNCFKHFTRTQPFAVVENPPQCFQYVICDCLLTLLWRPDIISNTIGTMLTLFSGNFLLTWDHPLVLWACNGRSQLGVGSAAC